MVKYVITVSHEIDGHAGATTGYLQVDRRLTRKEKLRAVNAMFGTDTKFVESEYRSKQANESDMDFYGELITKEGEFTFEETVSITMGVLPSRMKKGRLYTTFSRTG